MANGKWQMTKWQMQNSLFAFAQEIFAACEQFGPLQWRAGIVTNCAEAKRKEIGLRQKDGGKKMKIMASEWGQTNEEQKMAAHKMLLRKQHFSI